MDAEVAALRRALIVEQRKRIEQYRSLRAEARAALRMIREVVEILDPACEALLDADL
jgi:hypothetical protein